MLGHELSFPCAGGILSEWLCGEEDMRGSAGAGPSLVGRFRARAKTKHSDVGLTAKWGRAIAQTAGRFPESVRFNGSIDHTVHFGSADGGFGWVRMEEPILCSPSTGGAETWCARPEYPTRISLRGFLRWTEAPVGALYAKITLVRNGSD